MLLSFIRIIRTFMRRRATLAQIARLDDRTLRDLGLARGQLPSSWGSE